MAKHIVIIDLLVLGMAFFNSVATIGCSNLARPLIQLRAKCASLGAFKLVVPFSLQKGIVLRIGPYIMQFSIFICNVSTMSKMPIFVNICVEWCPIKFASVLFTGQVTWTPFSGSTWHLSKRKQKCLNHNLCCKTNQKYIYIALSTDAVIVRPHTKAVWGPPSNIKCAKFVTDWNNYKKFI